MGGERELDRDKILEFFRRLDPQTVQMEYLRLYNMGETEEVVDSVYRVFHYSFKMYGFKPSRYIEHMLRPLGYNFENRVIHSHPVEPYGMDVIDAFEEWKPNLIFMDLIRPAQAIKWSHDRNPHPNWVADGQVILAATLTAREVAMSTLAAMDRMVRGVGFLWDIENKCFLDSVDAMFLEVWSGLGLTLRYRAGSNEDICIEAREILKPKLIKTDLPPDD